MRGDTARASQGECVSTQACANPCALEEAELQPVCCGSGHTTKGSSAPYRDLNKARTAYQARDVAATRAAHCGDSYRELLAGGASHSEPHLNASSEYLKAIVFGGLDGIVTIFAIVAGCVGANLSPSKVVLVGLGNLLADAISMGFGEYVSSSAEEDYIKSEREREEWEVENCPDDEKQEMVDIYTDRYGMTAEDARALVGITFRYRHFFVQHMMVEELGLMANSGGPSAVKTGLAMFFSFCTFGMLPLAGFIGWLATFGANTTAMTAFFMACIVSITALFVLGFVKGRFVNQNSFNSGILMVLNGTIAGTVAYGVGGLLQDVVGNIG